MISGISSNLPITSVGSSGSSSGANTKLSELTKQVNALRQKLSQAQKAKSNDSDSVQANSITQEIVNVQAQIERLVLEAQLSKVTAGNKADSSSNNKSAQRQGLISATPKDPSKPAHAPPTGLSTDPYQDNLVRGTYIDVEA